MNYKGVLVGIGIAIVVFYFVNKDKTSKDANVNSNHEDTKETVSIINHSEKSESDCIAELNDVKAGVAKRMYERYGEAEKIVKESIGNIFGYAEVQETKNDAVKKDMFEDLGNI